MASIPLKFQSLEELVGNLNQLDNSTLNYLVNLLKKLQLERGINEENLMLNEQKFWKLIELIDWKQKENEKILQPLIKALAANSEAVIYQFSERLAFYLHELDGPAFTKALEADEIGFSADTFLYARCLAVAKGEKFYKKVLAKPEKMPVGEDFEALLYIAEAAYYKKTGKTYQYVPTINYESFFNQKLWGEKAIVL